MIVHPPSILAGFLCGALGVGLFTWRALRRRTARAIEAARDCLAAETPDIAGAFTYLKMARPEPSELMAMAALHRATGTLEQELQKAKSQEGKDAHLWRYALYATAGQLKEAAAEADDSDEDDEGAAAAAAAAQAAAAAAQAAAEELCGTAEET